MHVCDPLTCGLTPDPECPCWTEPDHPRGSRAWAVRCSPQERTEYTADLALSEQVARAADLLRPVLVELLREALAEIVAETLARDLPELMRAVQVRGYRGARA